MSKTKCFAYLHHLNFKNAVHEQPSITMSCIHITVLIYSATLCKCVYLHTLQWTQLPHHHIYLIKSCYQFLFMFRLWSNPGCRLSHDCKMTLILTYIILHIDCLHCLAFLPSELLAALCEVP